MNRPELRTLHLLSDIELRNLRDDLHAELLEAKSNAAKYFNSVQDIQHALDVTLQERQRRRPTIPFPTLLTSPPLDGGSVVMTS